MLGRYRRTGADPPFGDPGRAHGTPLEGYYWRLTDPRAGRVVVVLCGVCRAPGAPWAVVALAAHPGGFLRYATVAPVTTDERRFGVSAGSVLDGSAERLSLRLGPDAWVEADLRPHVPGPGGAFGALGVAHWLPRLPQYWHPVVLGGGAGGEAGLGDATVRLDGATAYAEKNWGGAFPDRWWWGHADAFPDVDASVAFAGGPLALGPATPSATAVVIRLGEEIRRLVPPLALIRADVTEDAWRIRARSPRHLVEIEGDGGGTAPHVLPVPDIGERQVRMRSRQHLAGRVILRMWRGRSLLLSGESPLAGLELGLPDGPSG